MRMEKDFEMGLATEMSLEMAMGSGWARMK